MAADKPNLGTGFNDMLAFLVEPRLFQWDVPLDAVGNGSLGGFVINGAMRAASITTEGIDSPNRLPFPTIPRMGEQGAASLRSSSSEAKGVCSSRARQVACRVKPGFLAARPGRVFAGAESISASLRVSWLGLCEKRGCFGLLGCFQTCMSETVPNDG
ncbi:hypothetical protein BC830DRAFT_1132891 [Chytriomyces sp. MP71]|nr:hypothetical protein BC830DRAFT_1132891 [Chytriomyces sp. MP71]